jgi:DNA-binding Lrp family transcriptional regulator
MVNPRRVGFPMVADILIEVEPWKLAETCAKLLKIESVASASASHAGRQLSIQANARDEGELASFVRTTLPQIDGFVSAHAVAVPFLLKDLAYWSPPDFAAIAHGRVRGRWHEKVDDTDASFRLDDLDRQIIRLSQEDPRMSSRDMARRVGDISDRVVRYRIRRLLDSDILLVQARLNPHKVGYPIVADTLVQVVPWKFAGVCAALAAMEPVCYISAAPADCGGRQLSIETNSRNESELTAFVKTQLPRIDGVVGAQTMVVPRLVKDVATWRIPRSR